MSNHSLVHLFATSNRNTFQLCFEDKKDLNFYKKLISKIKKVEIDDNDNCLFFGRYCKNVERIEGIPGISKNTKTKMIQNVGKSSIIALFEDDNIFSNYYGFVDRDYFDYYEISKYKDKNICFTDCRDKESTILYYSYSKIEKELADNNCELSSCIQKCKHFTLQLDKFIQTANEQADKKTSNFIKNFNWCGNLEKLLNWNFNTNDLLRDYINKLINSLTNTRIKNKFGPVYKTLFELAKKDFKNNKETDKENLKYTNGHYLSCIIDTYDALKNKKKFEIHLSKNYTSNSVINIVNSCEKSEMYKKIKSFNIK